MAAKTVSATLAITATPSSAARLAAKAKASDGFPYSLGFRLGVRSFAADVQGQLGFPFTADSDVLAVTAATNAGTRFWAKAAAPLAVTANISAGPNRWVWIRSDTLAVYAWRPNEPLRTAHAEADLAAVASVPAVGACSMTIDAQVGVVAGEDGTAHTYYSVGADFLPFFYAQAEGA